MPEDARTPLAESDGAAPGALKQPWALLADSAVEQVVRGQVQTGADFSEFGRSPGS